MTTARSYAEYERIFSEINEVWTSEKSYLKLETFKMY